MTKPCWHQHTANSCRALLCASGNVVNLGVKKSTIRSQLLLDLLISAKHIITAIHTSSYKQALKQTKHMETL